MRIYVSGINGVAMGPLAMIARDIGHEIIGSTNMDNDLAEYMREEGFSVHVGQEDGYINSQHQITPIDWFVYTAALPDDHPELQFAQSNGIRSSKRDEFINDLLSEHDLKMLAISGTHGKTNTTGMVVWCLMQAGISISYSIGSRITFGPFGKYEEGSEYFIYEADEFDRNMLKFEPAVSLITNIDFDHPDTYASRAEYQEAFKQFVDNSMVTYIYTDAADTIDMTAAPGVHTIEKDPNESMVDIPGVYIRQNARLVIEMLTNQFGLELAEAIGYVNSYPGTSRRMEKLEDNLYTDYAHHPDEIRSVIQQARELSDSVIVVYQPHQNIRQHEILEQYKNCFEGAKKIYWLPTYLSREAESKLELLSQRKLIEALDNPEVAEQADMNNDLIEILNQAKKDNTLVLCLSAGDLDDWVRENLVS